VKLREATPYKHERGIAFVTRSRGCGLEDIRTPLYDVCPGARAISATRKEAGLGLRDAAIKFGIRAVELSGLESGRLVPEDPNEWATMTDKIRETRALR